MLQDKSNFGSPPAEPGDYQRYLYRLPKDFPGQAEAEKLRNHTQRVAHLRQCLYEHFSDQRFSPYFSTHEFESLILNFPTEIASIVGNSSYTEQDNSMNTDPESINHENPPARRIAEKFPRYRKALHGPSVIERIGIPAIRKHCLLFNEWITSIEQLGGDRFRSFEP